LPSDHGRSDRNIVQAMMVMRVRSADSAPAAYGEPFCESGAAPSMSMFRLGFSDIKKTS
jgi:hypothetical protein